MVLDKQGPEEVARGSRQPTDYSLVAAWGGSLVRTGAGEGCGLFYPSLGLSSGVEGGGFPLIWDSSRREGKLLFYGSVWPL